MDIGLETLSQIVTFNKYAKYLPQLNRRETYEEIVLRYVQMMVDKYPHMADKIVNQAQYIFDKKILPSMRALQFAGPAIQKNEARIYNCCYLPIDDYRAFGEIMFLLLGGTGVGYSVQFKHIEKLPEIRKPSKEQKFLVGAPNSTAILSLTLLPNLLITSLITPSSPFWLYLPLCLKFCISFTMMVKYYWIIVFYKLRMLIIHKLPTIILRRPIMKFYIMIISKAR